MTTFVALIIAVTSSPSLRFRLWAEWRLMSEVLVNAHSPGP